MRRRGFSARAGTRASKHLPQIVKIPHLRNVYDKIGMFGNPSVSFFQQADSGIDGQSDPRVWLHGRRVDGYTVSFSDRGGFRSDLELGLSAERIRMRRASDVEQYLLAFDSDLAPIVGQQVTLTPINAAAAGARIDLLINRASTPFVSKALGGSVNECDLVAQVVRNGRIMGFLYDPLGNDFIPDDGSTPLSDAAIRAFAATPGQEVTYTAATPGSGARIAFARWAPRGPVERRR